MGIHVQDRKYLIQLSDDTAVLEDLGTFVIDSMQLISQKDTERIVKNVSTCSADLLSDIAAVVAERDSSNKAAEYMTPVLPHQLAKMRGRDFADVIRTNVLAYLFVGLHRKKNSSSKNFRNSVPFMNVRLH
ncbi:hypothetical protein PsorP6_005169 [Peronosclerospora sorghi]|uniref:Uncharacterized protein n=1 Tax=Peronosclerospora sorghi TaxID=230839 RepID=A0ACC0W482_9STRA|nr:hypothetical protein PsorP6_005169 [Peronosclerospora sorghi]